MSSLRSLIWSLTLWNMCSYFIFRSGEFKHTREHYILLSDIHSCIHLHITWNSNTSLGPRCDKGQIVAIIWSKMMLQKIFVNTRCWVWSDLVQNYAIESILTFSRSHFAHNMKNTFLLTLDKWKDRKERKREWREREERRGGEESGSFDFTHAERTLSLWR